MPLKLSDFDVVISNAVFYLNDDSAVAIMTYGQGRLPNITGSCAANVQVKHCLFWRIPEGPWRRFKCACVCFWLTLTTGKPHVLPEPEA